jgi:hypothetical protein
MQVKTEIFLEMDRFIIEFVAKHWEQAGKPAKSAVIHGACIAKGYTQNFGAIRWRLNKLQTNGSILGGKNGYLPRGLESRVVKRKEILRSLVEKPKTLAELVTALGKGSTQMRNAMRAGEALHRSEGVPGRPLWWATPSAEEETRAQLAFEERLLNRLRAGEDLSIAQVAAEMGVGRFVAVKNLAWLFNTGEAHLFGHSLRLGPNNNRPSGECPAEIRAMLARGGRTWADLMADLQEAGFTEVQVRGAVKALLRAGELVRPCRGTYCLASDITA